MSSPLERLASLRQHQADGRRSPHKPMLVLLALGRLAQTGTSEISWTEAENQLAQLIANYGPPSTTGRAQRAAYPFTRLRSDGVWLLDHDVPMDSVGALRAADPAGRLDPRLEAELRADPEQLASAARVLLEAHFPDTVGRDILVDVGLDPELVYGGSVHTVAKSRRRSTTWRVAVLQAWDQQCAFCGFDGMLGGVAVAVEAAHVRWFNHEGPDAPDNGLALCSLHHKLFDRGALGLGSDHRIRVSAGFSARTDVGRATYELQGKALDPRPGTVLPADEHITWHTEQVFHGEAIAA